MLLVLIAVVLLLGRLLPRRGAEPLTEEGVRRRVADDERALGERREAYLAGREIEQLLAAKNERRVARGEPPVTLGEYQKTLR